MALISTLPQYIRFAYTHQATDAEIQPYRIVTGTPDAVVQGGAAGEILGVNLILKEAKDETVPQSLVRDVTIAESGVIAIESDGSVAVGDVVQMLADGRATTDGTNGLAITLQGKDLICREVASDHILATL